MDGPLLKMFFSFSWVCNWTLSNCLHFTLTSLEANANLPNLKLLTPSQAANALALKNAITWFSVAGVGPAFLAVLLKAKGHGRIRRVLACVGLASAVAIHCVDAWLIGLTLVTAPSEDLLVKSVFSACVFILFGVIDVHAALFLLRRRPGGKE